MEFNLVHMYQSPACHPETELLDATETPNINSPSNIGTQCDIDPFVVVMEENTLKTKRTPEDMYKEKHTTLYNIYRRRALIPTPKDTFMHCTGVQSMLFNAIKESSMAASSQVSYANAIKRLAVNMTPAMSNEIDEFIKEKKKAVALIENENGLDGKEEKRWMSWSDILELYENLVRNYDATIKFGIANRDKVSYRTAQQRLLLALYVLHPPLRLNYASVALYPEDPTKEDAYITRNDDNGHTMFINTDKVSRKIGPYQFDLHPDIMRIASEIQSVYFPTEQRKYLLTSTSNSRTALDKPGGFGHKTNTYKLLRSIKTKEGKDSILTVDTIRSAFVTDYLKKDRTNNEKNDMAKKMRTSSDMMDRSYRKVIKTNDQIIEHK